MQAHFRYLLWELFWCLESGLTIVLLILVAIGAVKVWSLLLLWIMLHTAHPIILCTITVIVTVLTIGRLANEYV